MFAFKRYFIACFIRARILEKPWRTNKPLTYSLRLTRSRCHKEVSSKVKITNQEFRTLFRYHTPIEGDLMEIIVRMEVSLLEIMVLKNMRGMLRVLGKCINMMVSHTRSKVDVPVFEGTYSPHIFVTG